MTLPEIRETYLRFFEKKGHVIVPSSPLVPENDPTTLFTGSGMQPMLPYLLGAPHPLGMRIADSQRCFRTQDIEEVGDNRHTTLFEMLGNWSLGDYFKEEQIRWFWEFLTKELSLDPARIFVTCYIGNEQAGIPKDTESAALWRALFGEAGIDAREIEIGSEEKGYERGEQGGRIFYYGDKNWWSRAGAPGKMPSGEPGGPDTEVFYLYPSVPHDSSWGENCHPNCDCGRYIELGNSVFMQYRKTEDGFEHLPKKNVDYGGGLERLLAAANDTADVFPANHGPILSFLETQSGKSYGSHEETTRAFRIVADHMKAAVFLIGDQVLPGNSDRSYFVRRLIRRAVRYADQLGIKRGVFSDVVRPVADMYADSYPFLGSRIDTIKEAIADEEGKFRRTLENGLREFEKVSRVAIASGQVATRKPGKGNAPAISGKDAFQLYQTYGFPIELTEEISREAGLSVDFEEFSHEMERHRDLSRTASVGKFKGGLADASEKTTRLHTATHLLLAGLRSVLGESVHQAGSNITEERTRFDFTFPEKVSREALDRVEAYVNEAIDARSVVIPEIMEKEAARRFGVEGSFWEKYPDTVTVYCVRGKNGVVYSRELCGGPHVETTRGMGRFRIVKEEASSAGIRRIKAVLEER